MTKKFSKEEIEHRAEVLKSMFYTLPKEEMEAFMCPPKKRRSGKG